MRKFVYTDGRTKEEPLMSSTDMGEFTRKGIITHIEGNPLNHGSHPGDLTFFFCDRGFFVLGAEDKSVSDILTLRNQVRNSYREPEDRTLLYFFQSSDDWRIIPNASLEFAASVFWKNTKVEEVRKTLIESCGYAADISGNELVHLDYAHINGYEVPNTRPIMSMWLTKKCTLKKGEVREYPIRHVLKEGTFSEPVKRLNWSGPAPSGGTTGGSIVLFEDGSALLFSDEEEVTNIDYWQYVAEMKHRAISYERETSMIDDAADNHAD